jgi:hypothetical protein
MTVSDHTKTEQPIPYYLHLTPSVIAMKETERLSPNKEKVWEKREK